MLWGLELWVRSQFSWCDLLLWVTEEPTLQYH